MNPIDTIDLKHVMSDVNCGRGSRIFGYRIAEVLYFPDQHLFELRIDVNVSKTNYLLIRVDETVYPDGIVPLDLFYEVFKAREISEKKKPEYRQVSGVVRLWRIWRHKDGLLYPLNHTDQPWKKNPEGFIESHDIPGKGTSAGFYGFYRAKTLPAQESRMVEMARTGDRSGNNTGMTYVLGSFLAWGVMTKATFGCRVQYAKPEYLILPDKNEDYALELMTLAEEYGMKPITAEQARELKGGHLPGATWEKRNG